MLALLAASTVKPFAIRRRTQGIEIEKRAPGAAQHHGGLFFTRNLAKPGSVNDLFVTDGAFVLRGIRAWPGVSLWSGGSHNKRWSASATESRALRRQLTLASGTLSE
jgi:hypothetical protein